MVAGAHELLLAVLDSLDTAVVGCDADGVPTMSNRAARDLFGPLLDEVAVAQWPHRLALTDAAGEPFTDGEFPLLRALDGESVHGVELVVRPPGKPQRVFRVQGRPVAGGDRAAAVMAVHEITVQRRAALFKECELRIGKLLNRPEPMDQVLSDAVELIGGMLDWSATEFWSVDEVGQVLRRVSSWIGHDDTAPDRWPDQLAYGQGLPGHAWKTSEAVWAADDHAAPRSPARWTRRAALAVPIPSGSAVLGVLACYSDTTETPDDVRTAVMTGIATHIGEFLERRRAEQHAAELERTRNEYIALVGHELRTPLTSVQAYTDLLAAEPDMPAGERADMLAVMQRSTAALQDLISKLLDVAGLRSGHLPLQAQPIDLVPIVRDAAREAREQAHETVRIAVNTPATAMIDGDRCRLQQVVDELLRNAVTWAREGSTIGLNLRADDRTATLTVSNTGRPILAEERNQLFEMFFRTAAARRRGLPGTGLGLTLARAIVEQHAGSITISEPDEPITAFTVRLRALPSPAAAEPVAAETSGSRG